VPWPVNSSSVLDTFNRIVALHNEGIKIHLHYYCTDSDNHPAELNQYCESIHPYEFHLPNTGIPGQDCTSLIKMADTLRSDIYPVLFEGTASTGIINEIAGSSRKLIVRKYNDDCCYYEHLATLSDSLLQKIKLKRLARKMKKYEDSLPEDCIYSFTSVEKADSFRKDHHHTTAHYLPVFTPYISVKCKTGIGNFCLYHGDLVDPCNEKAVLWLLSKVFNDINTPLVIAGKKPGKQITKLAEFYNHTCLIINPSQSEIDDLIAKAHINILPSFSNRRPEFKLVHALLDGRHCITNENAVKGTELEEACHVGKNANAFKSLLLQLYHRPFEEEEIELRKKIFNGLQKEKPVNALINWLFE
jgi:hypothetical protein